MTCRLSWVVNLTVSLTAKHHKHGKDLCSIFSRLFEKLVYLALLQLCFSHLYYHDNSVSYYCLCLKLVRLNTSSINFVMDLIFNSVRRVLRTGVICNSDGVLLMNWHSAPSTHVEHVGFVDLKILIYLATIGGLNSVYFGSVETKRFEFVFKIFTSPYKRWIKLEEMNLGRPHWPTYFRKLRFSFRTFAQSPSIHLSYIISESCNTTQHIYNYKV